MSADKFEEWRKGYYVEKGFISSESEMKAAWLASRKAALEEAAEMVDSAGNEGVTAIEVLSLIDKP